MKKQTLGNSLLLLTSLIWGIAFVAQKQGMEHVGPFTFCGIRFILSAAFVLIMVIVRDLLFHKKIILFEQNKKDIKIAIIGGSLCGLALGVATMFQQYSIQETTAGKAGFITALYIVLVPILGIIIKKKVRIVEWISVGIAIFSLALLCFKKEDIANNVLINKYDICLLICALCFSIQILLIDHFSKKFDCLWLASFQFIACALVCTIAMFIFEKPNMTGIKDALIPILYAGIASGGIAYSLQFVGQKYTNPVIASIIMSLESVISLIAGAILIHERLTTQELIGCLLMFVAIMIPQIKTKKETL